jgi:hypothetical protein
MKKILVLSIAILSVTAVFSQNGNRDYRSDRGQTQVQVRSNSNRNSNNSYSQNYGNNDQNRNGYNDQNRYGYNDQNRYGNNVQNRGYNDHQAEIAQINRDYDQRIISCRNDRSLSSYERDRRIGQYENERSQKIGSFGGGVVVGALALLVLGSLFSHH